MIARRRTVYAVIAILAVGICGVLLVRPVPVDSSLEIPDEALYPETPLPIPEAAKHITGAFVLSKSSFMAFEPIDVPLVVENAGDEDFRYPVGGADRGVAGADHNVFVHIAGPDGFDVPLHLGHRGGLVGQRPVPAGERYEQDLLLNAWADLIEPGDYTVTMRRELYGRPGGDKVQFAFPSRSRRLFVPPGHEVADTTLRRVMVNELMASRRAPTLDEAVQHVDWMLRMPMIESTFVIRIEPFEPEAFLEIVAERPFDEYGAVLAEGGCSDAIAIISLQLGLWAERISRTDVLNALREGQAPGPRDNRAYQHCWADQAIGMYKAFGIPEPYPLKPEHRAWSYYYR